MKAIDLLSQPPANKFSIFSEKRNKTPVGGCIFIIEILIIISIIFIFLFDHYKNDLYKIEYSNKFITRAKGSWDTADADERFDQELKFNFELSTDYYDNKLSENFVIADFENMNCNNKGYRKNGVTKKPSKLNIAIYYKCHNETVCKYFEKGNLDDDYTRTYYNLKISYSGFEINHQNSQQPLIDTPNPLTFKCPFLFDTITYTKLRWSNVKYEEATGMWSNLFSKYILKEKPVSYAKGYIESSDSFPIEVPDDLKTDKNDGNTYKLLAIIKIDNNIYEYAHYIRTKKSIFSTIANIASLITTTNLLLIKFLEYYSKNYDNYQIIHYLTTKKNKQKNEKSKNISKDCLEMKESSDSNNNIKNKKESNKDLKNDEDNNELLINEIDPEFENEINKGSNKINFLHFFLNNFYCDCCKRNKFEDMINISNDILNKYLSIDNLLYNQIMFENMLKDYKWNDNTLNGIKNNELIIKFKNFQ